VGAHFLAEADMAPPTAALAGTLLGRRKGPYEVFYEVQASRGVPDIVIAQFNEHAQRHDALTNPIDVAVVLALRVRRRDRRATVSTKELALYVGASPGHLSRCSLPRLRDLDLVEVASRGQWRAGAPFRPACRTVVTIELKKRDWSRALIQARAHGRGADYAWIVLDAGLVGTSSRSASSARAACAASRVGMALVDADQRLTIASRPSFGGPPTLSSFAALVARHTLGERLYDMRSRDEARGDTWPVFGYVSDGRADERHAFK
jgi:hypothetical protein